MKRRILPLMLLALGLVGYAWAAPKVPHDQHIEIALEGLEAGARGKPTEVTVRYARDGETQREATFHFPSGAPSVITHTARLPDGEYTVEIEAGGASVARNVKLAEGTITTVHARGPR